MTLWMYFGVCEKEEETENIPFDERRGKIAWHKFRERPVFHLDFSCILRRSKCVNLTRVFCFRKKGQNSKVRKKKKWKEVDVIVCLHWRLRQIIIFFCHAVFTNRKMMIGWMIVVRNVSANGFALDGNVNSMFWRILKVVYLCMTDFWARICLLSSKFVFFFRCLSLRLFDFICHHKSRKYLFIIFFIKFNFNLQPSICCIIDLRCRLHCNFMHQSNTGKLEQTQMSWAI